MEDTAAAVEAEAFIDAEALNIDTGTRGYYGTPDSASSSPTRVGEDDCISALSEISAPPVKQNYTVVANETSPLLPKHERMSTQLQSPIEIAGIEGADGQRRPWLRALGTKKIPWWETPSVFWLLPPFLIYCLAMGAVSVPKLNVILNIICRQYHFTTPVHNGSPIFALHSTIGDDNKECQTAEVHSLLGRFMLYANLISGCLCAISSPRLGALSDRYGRRLILAVTALGMLLGDVITITAATFPDSISVYWILVEYGFGGLAGSFIATMAVIQSYAADCTPPARRSIVFGYLHGCMFLGIAAGPVLGGLIIKAAGGNILTIFYVAFVCHLGFIVFVTSFIPESLSPDRQLVARERHQSELLKHAHTPWRAITNIANIVLPLKILFPSHADSSKITRTNLILLSTVDTVVFGVTLGSASLVVMYSEYMFKWGNFESSVFVSIANTCRVGMLILVLPLVSRVFNQFSRSSQHGHARNRGGNSDKFDISIIRFAVLFDVLGYIGYAVVPTGTLFIVSGIVASIGGIASPTLQSALTTHVAADKTGELLGAISLLHALSRIAVPAALHLVYSLTIGKASSAVFWCLAAVFGGAWVASWGIRPRERGGTGGGESSRGEYGRI